MLQEIESDVTERDSDDNNISNQHEDGLRKGVMA
jgi:hypothetical protein